MLPSRPSPGLSRLLFASAFFISTCGLVYELVAGALASYVLGDSITQFSLVIGVYLSAMGVGSYLSRFVDRGLVARFVEVEIAVALLGGFQSMLLFAAFAYTPAFRLALFGLVGVVGIGVGLELPLLMRVLEQQSPFKELVARILFLDYIGALFASVAFPMLLVPHLGLMRTSLAFGLVNGVVALVTTWLFEAPAPLLRRLRVMSVGALALLMAGFWGATALERSMEANLFADPVVYREQTAYQRIVVTNWDRDTRLFLDGALQFSSADEYRYHESLVHPALSSVAAPRAVLVMGGGDGMAVREILKHASVERVTLVDLDPAMTALFRDRPEFAALNHESLSDPRVTVVNADAFHWLDEAARGVQVEGLPEDGLFDAVIVDFPDPNNFGLGKLYTTHFYRLLQGRLAPGAAVALQATSPLYSVEAYWCIVRTLEHSGFLTRPYHAFIPAFGEWGFVLASMAPLPAFRALPDGLRFLDEDSLPTLFHFPRDMDRRDGPINRLDNQALVMLYDKDWQELSHR